MDQRASRLTTHCQDRLGDSLRAVGFHSDDTVEVAYIRDDLVERYPEDRVAQFIRSSRQIHRDLQSLDEGMGTPEASLHVLAEGLIVQFHYPGDDVIFLSMEREVGRNFTRFVDECIDRMAEAVE
jgi:hypothetical protein